MMRSFSLTRAPPYLFAAAGLAVVALAFVSLRSEGAEAGATVTIEVSNTKFCTPGQNPCPDSPLDTTVNAAPGDTIDFDHVSGFHTASHCTDATFTDCTGNLFDFSVTSVTGGGQWLIPAGVDNSNVYFRCNIHPSSMQGLIIVGNPATPTPTPSPTPSPSPTPGQATPTPSPLPTPTPTPMPTPALSGRSDVNCDGETDGDDVLALLFHAADAPHTASPQGGAGCAPIGTDQGDGPKGDLNCDGVVDGGDALVALLAWAGAPVAGLPAGCPGP